MRQGIVLAVSVLAGCASQAPPSVANQDPEHVTVFPRAWIEPKDVKAALAYEAEIARRADKLSPPGEAWFEVKEGPTRVVLTAPHATKPTREGELRFADGGTGGLVRILHDLTGATVIFTTAASPSDPNFYDDNDFKRTLRKVIQEHRPLLVLDIHASDGRRPYDIDFGTMNGQSLLNHVEYLHEIANQLRAEGVTNFSQDFFAASRNATVTKFVSALGVPCIQLEISSTWFAYDENTLQQHRLAQLIQALARAIRKVDPTAKSVDGTP